MTPEEFQKYLLQKKIKELQAGPYTGKTDELMDLTRQLNAMNPPEPEPQIKQYEPYKTQAVERVNPVEAAKFQKGLNEGYDVSENLQRAGSDVSDTWEKIKNALSGK